MNFAFVGQSQELASASRRSVAPVATNLAPYGWTICRFSKVTPNVRLRIKDLGMTFENSYWQFLKSLAKFLKLLASYISHVAYRQLASDISAIARSLQTSHTFVQSNASLRCEQKSRGVAQLASRQSSGARVLRPPPNVSRMQTLDGRVRRRFPHA